MPPQLVQRAPARNLSLEAPQDDSNRASKRRSDAGSAHTTAIPKASFAVAHRTLAVVPIRA